MVMLITSMDAHQLEAPSAIASRKMAIFDLHYIDDKNGTYGLSMVAECGNRERSRMKYMIGFVIAAYLWPTIAYSQSANFAETMWKTAKRTDTVGITEECRLAPTSIVQFYECDKGICGKIVALNPRDNQIPNSNLSELKDELNPCIGIDKKGPECAQLRERSIIGLKIFANIRKNGRFWVGDAYDACQGKYGQICIWWQKGRATMRTKGCKPRHYNCDGLFSRLSCTKEYTYRQVEEVPEGWVDK